MNALSLEDRSIAASATQRAARVPRQAWWRRPTATTLLLVLSGGLSASSVYGVESPLEAILEFNACDRDGDGAVSAAEWKATLDGQFATPPRVRNALFDKRARLGAIKPMIRTDVLRSLGLRYREDLHNGEDYVLLLEALLASARFVVSGEPLYLYRVHAGSISWRIGLDRLARLEQVHASLDLSRASTELTSAVEHYVGCLAAARAMTTTVEHAKAGRWSDALAMAAGTPRAWPLLGRTLTAAVAKRLSRVLWRPMDTSAARDARVSR